MRSLATILTALNPIFCFNHTSNSFPWLAINSSLRDSIESVECANRSSGAQTDSPNSPIATPSRPGFSGLLRLYEEGSFDVGQGRLVPGPGYHYQCPHWSKCKTSVAMCFPLITVETTRSTTRSFRHAKKNCYHQSPSGNRSTPSG